MKTKKKSFKVIRNYLLDPLIQFRFFTAFKITLIPVLSFFIVFAIMWLFVRMNLIFFEANGFLELGELKEVYYDYIYGGLTDYYFGFAIYTIVLFFLGNYISGLLLRPFKALSDYCEKSQVDDSASYSPDLFSDLKNMTRISEFFFQFIQDCQSKNELKAIKVPELFTQIHRPKFEKTYFAHFLLFLGAIGFFSSIALYMFSVDIQSQIIQLSLKTLNHNESVSYFLEKGSYFVNFVLWGSMVLQMFLYTILATNLYAKISPPSFGVFSTMRSFMKGNFSARVHLIGYGFLRHYCRTINKYLDHVQRAMNNHGKVSKQNKKVG